MENDVIVLTPEKTIITLPLASIGPRILAQLLDLFLVFLIFLGASTLIALTVMRIDQGLGTGLIIFTVSVLPFLYFILLEGFWNGQTVGKKAAGIRVRMADGTPITFAAALGRNLLRPADMLPGTYFVGLLAVFTNPRAQRIGDLVANTVVVLERRPEPRLSMPPHVVGIHPIEAFVGDLRGMTLDEYNALRRFADRFPELPPEIQSRLTEEVWRPLAERLKVPPLPDVHPIYVAEAMVMKYGREHGIL